MNGEHNSRHRARIEAILSAEWNLDHPELQTLRETCEQCEEDLRDLARAGRAVDASVHLEEETVRQGLESATEADDAYVQAHLQGLWDADQRRLRLRALRWTGVAAAAGLVVWFLWGPMLGSQTAGDPPGPKLQTLAESSAELRYPVGWLKPGEALDRFEWDVDLGPGESLTLRVWSEHAVDTTVIKKNLRGSSWSPSSEEQRAMGSQIEWELQHLAGGNPVATYTASAALQP